MFDIIDSCNKYIVTWSDSEESSHINPCLCALFYWRIIMKNIETILYNEALKAYKKNEVPVGCVIVKDRKIIAKGHNTRQKSHCCINHAEISAIIKAEKKLKDWRLDGCEMYVTLQPCHMCAEAIKQSRISRVYYITNSKFNESSFSVSYNKLETNNASKFSNLLSTFFKNKR